MPNMFEGGPQGPEVKNPSGPEAEIKIPETIGEEGTLSKEEIMEKGNISEEDYSEIMGLCSNPDIRLFPRANAPKDPADFSMGFFQIKDVEAISYREIKLTGKAGTIGHPGSRGKWSIVVKKNVSDKRWVLIETIPQSV